jgi:tetratricopeptide (TPR) repeat protein
MAATVLLCAPVASESEVNEWLKGAEQSAARVRAPWDEFQCWPLIARVYSRRGDIDRAMGAVKRISDDDWRWMAAAGLAREAAGRGAFEEARLILDRLVDRRLHNECLLDVASIASLQHKFEVAEQLSRLLDDARLRQQSLYALAAEEALARQYDLALRTSQRVGVTGEWQRARLLEFIEGCRRRGAFGGPTPITASLREEIFNLGVTGWMPRSEDISTHEREMRESLDPMQRAVSSTLMARWYQDRNETARCRLALATAAESLPRIRSDFERVRCCAELAETMRGAGLSAEARTLVDKIITRDALPLALKEPDDLAVRPRLVFVLIGLGKTADALEMAGSAHGLLRDADTWWAGGIACALEGKTEEVRRRLRAMEYDRDKAILSAGVALGLQELAEKEGNKTHR